MRRISTLVLCTTLLASTMACGSDSSPVDGNTSRDPRLSQISLPAGFSIDIYAEGVENARSMALGSDGTLFVGSRSEGKVYAVKDVDGDYKADQVFTIDSGLYMPNGVAFRDGSLYVAEVNRILRYDFIEPRIDNPPEPVIVSNGFPSDRHHGWKFIRFGPDNKLYVPVGGPCNVCEQNDERYATIMRMNPDGTDLEVYVSGVRNTVGFDWSPGTQELWFTDNGRDMLGNDIPPDELNRVAQAGQHFGFPYHHGSNIPDPDFGGKRAKDTTVSPALELDPHVAAIGMRFYTGTMFPEEYRNQIFIAEHGSWNRDQKIGYRVMLVRLNGSDPVSYEPFIEGWLQGEDNWGRPADVLVMPDGSMLVSDDQAGLIYRVTYDELSD